MSKKELKNCPECQFEGGEHSFECSKRKEFFTLEEKLFKNNKHDHLLLNIPLKIPIKNSTYQFEKEKWDFLLRLVADRKLKEETAGRIDVFIDKLFQSERQRLLGEVEKRLLETHKENYAFMVAVNEKKEIEDWSIPVSEAIKLIKKLK